MNQLKISLFCIFISLLSQIAFAKDQRPSILFVIADDWGWPHAGAYGAKDWIKTPNFDKIAKEGVLFQNAFTSNPKCCPCRASILTGRNSWQLKEAVNHMVTWPKEFITWTDLLEDAGYFVGLTGKGWGPGNLDGTGRVHNPAGKSYDKFKAKPPFRGMSSADYAKNFTDHFMKERPEGQPFCFWLGTKEPHRGYQDGAGQKAGKKTKDVELPAYYPESEIIRSDMLDYAVEVEHFDTHLGRAVEYLRKTGELDNTIIIVTSDHGMPFPRAKGQILEHSFHLPFAVRWGNQAKAGRKVNDFINVRDIAPTLMEVAGVDQHAQFTGTSFVDLLKSGKKGWINKSERDVMLIGKERHDIGRPNDVGYPVRAIRTTEFLYVHNYEPDRWPTGNPETFYMNCDNSPTKTVLTSRSDKYFEMSFGKRAEEELYKINQDPACVNNLAAHPEYANKIKELRSKMETMLKDEGDLRTLGKAEFYDTIEYVGKKGHGWEAYLEKQKSK